MIKQKISYLTVIAILGILTLFPLAMPAVYHIDEAMSPLFQKFPSQLGEWEGTDEDIDQRTYDILETRNVLARRYRHPDGSSAHLLLVGSQKDRRVAHPPEVCYIGSNYLVSDEEQKTVSINGRNYKVKEFLATWERNTNHKEHVLYLYKIGDRYTTNYYSQQLQFALDRLTRKSSEVYLIRLAGTRKEALPALLKEVISTLDTLTETEAALNEGMSNN